VASLINEFIVEFIDDVVGNSEGNDMGLLFRKSNESGGASAQTNDCRNTSRHFTSYGRSIEQKGLYSG